MTASWQVCQHQNCRKFVDFLYCAHLATGHCHTAAPLHGASGGGALNVLSASGRQRNTVLAALSSTPATHPCLCRVQVTWCSCRRTRWGDRRRSGKTREGSARCASQNLATETLQSSTPPLRQQHGGLRRTLCCRMHAMLVHKRNTLCHTCQTTFPPEPLRFVMLTEQCTAAW